MSRGKERVARLLYTAGWFLAVPIVVLYLVWRGLRQREYLQHWGERFLGHGASLPRGRTIWLHAVSVGETRAAQPLVEQLAREFPAAGFVLTHMTPTGRAVGESLARALPGRVVQRYLPYDLPFAVRRFLRETRPAVGVLMETEIWPNLLFGAHAAKVPVLLVNARLSEKSAAKASRIAALVRPAAACLAGVAAQSDADRARLQAYFGGPIEVTGNLKFDLAPATDLIAQGRALRARCGTRPVWLAASTRDGEEAVILDAFVPMARTAPAPGPLLLLVPRHPQRFDDVARLVAERGLAVVRRSSPQWRESLDDAAVLLGDSMGEMALYFAAADVTLMGGSLLPFGSQNLIESCAIGTPVVLGPSTFNFAQAATDAIAAGAALQVTDAVQALQLLAALSADRARLARMAAAALAFAHAHRGATERTAALVRGMLSADEGGGTG